VLKDIPGLLMKNFKFVM